MTQRVWTIDEDNYIKDNFGKITFKDMAAHFNCAIATVQKRVDALGLLYDKKTYKRWSEEEIEQLKEMSSKYLCKTIARKLNRSTNEVCKMARKLGITLIFKRSVWKKWKVNYLCDNINKLSLTKIEKELDVSYYQIMEKLNELGIEYISDRWTKEEEKILIDLSKKLYIREIAKVLNRSESAVLTKAYTMGLDYITTKKVFTDEELNYIKSNWKIVSVSDMARTLKASRGMVQKQADLMGLERLGNNPYRKWTKEEIDRLRELSKKKTITQLAKIFKTTNDAIQTVASNNSIKMIDEKIHWNDNDNELLKELAKTMDLNEIAFKMNRTTAAVRIQLRRLGIQALDNQKYKDSFWTDKNTEELIKLASQGKTLLEITKIMNKKDQTILTKVRELGISIKRDDYKPWTDDDILKLIELSKTEKISSLVSKLGRSSSSIIAKAHKLNISIIPDRKNWTEEEYQKLEQLVMVEKKSPKEIAKILGRTEDSIIIKINRRGLIIQTNNKRFWTKEEEILLSDLWGSEAIEKIAKKLNRTVSSIRNKAFLLGLGNQIDSNYDGLSIRTICELFNVRMETVSIYWVALGLIVKSRDITQSKSYSYVEINDLFEFLKNNQNIWDSRLLEINILGKEPEWLLEKRKNDMNAPIGSFGLDSLTKQQLVLAKQFFLNQQQDEDNDNIGGYQLSLKYKNEHGDNNG